MTMKKKIRLYVDTGFAGCRHEDFQDLPDDWEEMSEEEHQKYLDEEAAVFLQNCISFGAYVVDDTKQDMD
jgi:hypothetical protein